MARGTDDDDGGHHDDGIIRQEMALSIFGICKGASTNDVITDGERCQKIAQICGQIQSGASGCQKGLVECFINVPQDVGPI